MMTLVAAPAPYRRRKREYRHRVGTCSRLLFVGYLPPGTHIEIRCPACGRIHIVDVAAAPVDAPAPMPDKSPVDIEQQIAHNTHNRIDRG